MLKFVMLLNSSNYGEFSTNKAETKTKGRRTVASTAVISSLRDGLGSSDLPPFFNQNHFFMLPKNDDCATCANRPVTADSIISEFIRTAEMAMFSEGLHELFLTYVKQPDGCLPGPVHDDVIYTYVTLRDLINDVSKLQNLKQS